MILDRILAGAAVAFFVAAGVQTWRLHGVQRDYERAQAAWTAERLAASEVARKAESEYRQREQDMLAKLAKVEAESAKELALRDARIKSLQLAGSGLRDKLAAYTARGSGAPSDPAAAVADLQNRVETLGLLVSQRDAMAAEVEQHADDITAELGACRAYADTVKGATK